MNSILNKILAIPSNEVLLDDSTKAYLMSLVNDTNNPEILLDDAPIESKLRLLLILQKNILNDENIDKQYIDKAYTLLKTIDIHDEVVKGKFDAILGTTHIAPEVLYYFYLALLSLLDREIIRIRLDLEKFDNYEKYITTNNWKYKVITQSLIAFILLVRKKDGFQDIRKAIALILTLREEQSKFEEKYIEESNAYSPEKSIIDITGAYHLSKAVFETAQYLMQGYGYKGKHTDIVKRHIDFAKQVFEQNVEMSELITQLGRGLLIVMQNSIWSNTSNLSENIKKLCKWKAETKNFIDLLPSQKDALSRSWLDAASKVKVLQMPTSAGKTLLAEFHILFTKSLLPNSTIIYIVPSRALVNQIYYELNEDFAAFGLNIQKTVSATELAPIEDESLVEKIDILVSTPEKIDLLQRRKHILMDNVALFIIDEAHHIQNDKRGGSLELLLSILKKEKESANFLFLSPFLPEKGAAALSDWLREDKFAISPIRVDWQPAEKIMICIEKRKGERKIDLRTFPSEYNLKSPTHIGVVKTLNKDIKKDQDAFLLFAADYFNEKGKSILFFCDSKQYTEDKAQLLIPQIKTPVICNDLQTIKKFIEEDIGTDAYLITKALSKGIVIHHAGLSDEVRILVEYLIQHKEKPISHIFATPTLVEGVNFPISTIYFATLKKGRKAWLTPHDFWNIVGRAGRTLVDNVGKVIFPITSEEDFNVFKGFQKDRATELSSTITTFLRESAEVAKAFDTYDDALQSPLIQKYYDSLRPLVQYLVHLLSLSEEMYYSYQIEDLFKDSLGYYTLDTIEKQQQFIKVCHAIYNHLNRQGKGVLTFADKTGYSVSSVKQIRSAVSKGIDIKSGWNEAEIFEEGTTSNAKLDEKIEVLSKTKEFTDNPTKQLEVALLTDIIGKWASGKTIHDIWLSAKQYTSYQNIKENKITDMVKQINDLRFKASWGMGVLEGLVKGNMKDIKDSSIPAYIYLGVNNRKALLLRLIGLPRMLSIHLATILPDEINSINSTRSWVKNQFNDNDNTEIIPPNSILTLTEWKLIVNILTR